MWRRKREHSLQQERSYRSHTERNLAYTTIGDAKGAADYVRYLAHQIDDQMLAFATSRIRAGGFLFRARVVVDYVHSWRRRVGALHSRSCRQLVSGDAHHTCPRQRIGDRQKLYDEGNGTSDCNLLPLVEGRALGAGFARAAADDERSIIT